MVAALTLTTTLAGAADSKGIVAKADLEKCVGFTVQDAAAFLGVPAPQVARHIERISKTLVVCSFAAGRATPAIAFSIEIEPSIRKAVEQMDLYRDNLSTTGDTAPWKGKLPKGAYSDIVGAGLGDEAVWTDINGTLTVRKANATIQVTLPKARPDQIKLAQTVAAKF
ncbi:hypothetical protein [Rhodoferax sp.]|uniref:hypothetical protein n=1 Tax=Rhodoferax sp. TaxID=50421 RepID=UPI002779D8F1|nr:hypothetical protein [Rhodoferax sp.]